MSRVTRRGFQTRSSIPPPSSLAPQIAASDVNKLLIRADNRLLSNLNALSISINHIAPPSIRPPTIGNSIEDPRANILNDIDAPLSQISYEITEKPLQIIQELDLPTADGTDNVKQAKKTTIRIRRRKMRKHKLKKLRKRMKFEWAKKKQKRLLKKEKDFHAMLIGQIKEAEKFSAEDYVTEKLNKSKPLELENQRN